MHARVREGACCRVRSMSRENQTSALLSLDQDCSGHGLLRGELRARHVDGDDTARTHLTSCLAVSSQPPVDTPLWRGSHACRHCVCGGDHFVSFCILCAFLAKTKSTVPMTPPAPQQPRPTLSMAMKRCGRPMTRHCCDCTRDNWSDCH
jgi:hypothetical protein